MNWDAIPSLIITASLVLISFVMLMGLKARAYQETGIPNAKRYVEAVAWFISLTNVSLFLIVLAYFFGMGG